jgi:hypothetical protein
MQIETATLPCRSRKKVHVLSRMSVSGNATGRSSASAGEGVDPG